MSVRPEVGEAVNVLVRVVNRPLDEKARATFIEQLGSRLEARVSDHWYPNAPTRGSGHRCVLISGGKVDPILVESAKAAAVASSVSELRQIFPTDLALWIDPGDVAIRLGNEQVWSVSRFLQPTTRVGSTAREEAARCESPAQRALSNLLQSASSTMSVSAPSFCPSGIVQRIGIQAPRTAPTSQYIMAR
mmetsp:Transcript_1352/g.3690  ORF Transcript_1352/g.3690 Transcript_1352/m.3690 type:complete len:190 (+) Transcript_1352:246-815(+)